jgi:hypothetical protein
MALPLAAAALGVFALGAVALAAPPIRQSLGLAASTATPTTVAAPTTVRVNSLAPSVAPTQAPASTATATAQPTTTTAPSPTREPTRTAAPTASPAPSATVASPTPNLPPGVTALATVRLSEGIAGRLRDGPNGTVIGGVPGNSRVQVLQGRATTDDGLVWVEIIVVDSGARGWIAESLLAYDATPNPQ